MTKATRLARWRSRSPLAPCGQRVGTGRIRAGALEQVPTTKGSPMELVNIAAHAVRLGNFFDGASLARDTHHLEG